MNRAFYNSYQCLDRVFSDGAFSTIELNKLLNICNASDKSLITKIVYGVLDNNILLQHIISQFATKLKGASRLILKMGTYCLMFLNIPVYTVVNDMAELAKITEDMRIVGFVNATLKNISKAIATNTISYPSDRLEYISVKYSYPMWALSKLVKDYGYDTACSIVSHRLSQDNTIRVNTSAISVQDFISILQSNNISYSTTMLEDCLQFKGRLNIDEHLYTPMSLASMMIARSLAVEGNANVLDCCSAPGGKAVYIKQLAPQSNITACDIHAHRVALIERYASRMGVAVETVCSDSTIYNDTWDSQYQYVLCDVPCSGYGVVDSRPDIKLFRQNIDISHLKKLQYDILCNCSRYVSVGGVLLYSTCTVFHNENRDNIKKFLAEHHNFALSPLPLEYYKGASQYQFLPHIDNTQGFYLARLVRNS